MNKKCAPAPSEVRMLFSNSDPETVWASGVEIVRHINPAFDFLAARTTFDDVVRMFRGEYPGYAAIATPYHDLSHTLSVFICAIRLMHGAHISGLPLTEREMNAIMISALLHDVGYAQQRGSEIGTGAHFTQTHVSRGIKFMRRYASEHNFPADLTLTVGFLLQSTDHMKGFARVDFPDERTRLLGQIVSTADLVGQMADRLYLEKLMFLYFEFKESRLGNYKNIHDLLGKSFVFYEHTLRKLKNELGGMVERLSHHFKECMGVRHNYYIESMEKNISYLAQVLAHGEAGYTALLRRGEISSRVQLQFAAEYV